MNHSGLVDLVQITNPEDLGSGLPSCTAEDAGKVLKVDNNGVPGWGEDAMATVDQTYDATSTHAQSGIAVAQAISNIPSVTVDQTYDASSTNAQSGVAVAEGLATKQDTISDLSTIRSGASAGATAVQPGDLATVATTGSYNDLSNKPSIPSAQVNSDWNASSGVAEILNKPNLATVATTGDYADLSNKPSIPAAQVNSDWNSNSGVSQILNKPNLATVATSGSYNDLSDKPSIPSQVTVDQTYSASSTNAQSGTAVAGAIATIKQVPASTSSDSNKVLTVNSQGTPAWADTQLPEEKSLVEGTGIDITEGADSVTISLDTPVEVVSALPASPTAGTVYIVTGA